MPKGTPAWSLPGKAFEIISYSVVITPHHPVKREIFTMIEILELSKVCQSWRHGFMTDNVWKQFDVYNVKKDICSHFLEEVKSIPRQEIAELIAPVKQPYSQYSDWDASAMREYIYNSANRYTCATTVAYGSFDRHYEFAQSVRNTHFMLLLLYSARRRLGTSVEMPNRYMDLCAHYLLEKSEFIIAAVKHCDKAFMYAAESLKRNRKVAMAALSSYYTNAQHLDEAQLKDKDLALAAVRCNGRALEYFKQFQSDHEVITAALAAPDGEHAIPHMPETLFSDKSFILEAMDCNWRVVLQAHESLDTANDIAKKLLKIHKGNLKELFDVIKVRPGQALWVLRLELMDKAGVDPYESHDSEFNIIMG